MPSWTWRTDGFVLLSRSFLHAAGVVIFLSHTVSEPPPAADGGLQLLAELLDLAALLLRFCLPLPLLGLQLIDPLLLSIQWEFFFMVCSFFFPASLSLSVTFHILHLFLCSPDAPEISKYAE